MTTLQDEIAYQDVLRDYERINTEYNSLKDRALTLLGQLEGLLAKMRGNPKINEAHISEVAAMREQALGAMTAAGLLEG